MTLRVIVVNTGTKYDKWYSNNIEHMVKNYSNLSNYEFIELSIDRFEMQVANKLVMFNEFRDGQNIYFDLDSIIKGDCNQFLKKDLHVCHAWWRPAYHTPINSSIISWEGDLSHIYKTYEDQEDYFQLKYSKGIDEYLYREFNPKTYSNKGYSSFQTVTQNRQSDSVVLYNQRYEYLTSQGWWSQFQLPVPEQLLRPQARPSRSG